MIGATGATEAINEIGTVRSGDIEVGGGTISETALRNIL